MDSFEKTLTTAKVQLIRTFPFLAFAVISTEYHLTTIPQIKTMAATLVGRTPTVLINEEFLLTKLTCTEERTFVLAHDLLHLFFMHLGRQTDRGYNPRLWDAAADFCINLLLVSLKSKHLQFPAFGGLYDEKYVGMSADAIYAQLLGDSGGDADAAADKFGMPGDGGNSPFDRISKAELTQSQVTNIKAQLAASMQGGSLAGDMRNSSLVNELYKLITPVISWREVLRNSITRSRNEYNSYRRYNSRSGVVIFPKSDGEKIDLLIGLDSSGSMGSGDIAEGLVETKSIVEEFANWNVQFVTCEMKVNVVGEYASENGDDFSSFSTNFNRGGGTDMNPIIAHAEESDHVPNVVIIFTDGFLTKELTSSHLSVIVVVTKNGNKSFTSAHHQVIHVD